MRPAFVEERVGLAEPVNSDAFQGLTGLSPDILSTSMGRVPGWIRVPGLAVTGMALGWLGGLVWFSSFGPSFGDFGSGGEGWAEVFRGMLAGGVTGALFGWLAARAPTGRIGSILLVLVGSVTAAVLIVVGVSYIGDWTNADGPVGFAPYVGVLGIPTAVLIVWAMWRLTARQASVPTSESA